MERGEAKRESSFPSPTHAQYPEWLWKLLDPPSTDPEVLKNDRAYLRRTRKQKTKIANSALKQKDS